MRLLISLLTLATISASTARAADRPPNFLVIFADDLGAKELGCYGNTLHKTPNLDALAAGGVRFKTCYATPICSPSRVEIMTGRYGYRTGWNNLIGRAYAPPEDSPQFDIGTSQFTFADLLKTKGYATALAGKWQLSGKLPTLVTDCGFDEYRMWAYTENLPKGVTHTGAFQKSGKTTSRYWHPSILTNGQYTPTTATDYGPDLFNAFLIDFMSRNKDKPFLAYYPTPLTHGPHDPTPDPAKPGEKTPAGFKSNLEYLDHQAGQLIAALDRLKLRENTIVIFTGDNGTAGDGKGRATELGARVPMIVNCPGVVKAGVVSDELVDVSDVFATLADFSGTAPPAGHVIDGKSFRPIVQGEGGTGREWIFSAIRNERVLRDKRWLLEGDGRFFDCGDKRDHEGYRDVTDSKDAEVVAARQRFDAILKNLPAPPAEDEVKKGKGERRRARVGDE
jgi:arylsulfatase A-like enzyme